jgi:hypothetical protein
VFINTSYYFNELQRFRPAVACLQRGVVLGRRLVEQEGRAELANDLAAALMNKGVALETTGSLSEALICYTEGICWREQLAEAGLGHLTPKLVKSYWIRFDLLRQMGRWPDAASDVARAIHVSLPFLQADDPPPPLLRELANFLRAVNGLSTEQRQQLDDSLGKDADLVRQLIELFFPK